MSRQERTGTRTSRTQEMHDAVSVHDDEPTILFEEAGPMPQIPARPGFTQRWVRVATKEGADGQNMARMAQRGWKPRPADTVPKALQFYTVQKEGLGGVIGTHDCVLMERRSEIEAKSAAMNKERRRDLERAVKGNLFSETKGNVNHESRSQVERGRPVHVADD